MLKNKNVETTSYRLCSAKTPILFLLELEFQQNKQQAHTDMETGCITFTTATSTPSRPAAAAFLSRRAPSFRQSRSKCQQLFQIRSYNYNNLSQNTSCRKNKSSLVVKALNQSLSSKGDLSNYAAPSWLPRFEELDTTNMLLRQRIIFLGTQVLPFPLFP